MDLITIFSLVRKKHPDWSLDIIGDGPEKEKLSNYIEELGLSDVMITCKKDNIASAKVIEANGGKLHEEVYIPEEDDIFKIYWINVYESLIKNDIGKIL